MEFEITGSAYFTYENVYRVSVKCPDGRRLFVIIHLDEAPDDELVQVLNRRAIDEAKEVYAREINTLL